MITVDPTTLARHQMTMDRAKTARMPQLFDRKMARMTQSPLALLRGSAPLFYDILATHPSLAEGARGKGWLAGDLHLENFGAYRPLPIGDEHEKTERGGLAAFDLNDFDDGVVGPWRFDVLRLVTSLILGGRELGADGPRVLDLAHALVDAYGSHVSGEHKGLPEAPECVDRLVERVAGRSRKELLDARTVIKHGQRQFVRGDRYLDLPPAIGKRVEGAFLDYVRGLDEDMRPDREALDVVDAAWRVAGCGSLGGVRVAVLARGKGGVDGAWVFDMKEEETPSATRVLGRPAKRFRFDPAERVCAAYRACVDRPSRLLGATTLGGRSMFVRRLAPQEDKLDLTALRSSDLDPLAVYLGALTGRAHARGATKKPRKAWTHEERDALVDRAIALAGIHEAIYLALCKLVREGASARRDARSTHTKR